MNPALKRLLVFFPLAFVFSWYSFVLFHMGVPRATGGGKFPIWSRNRRELFFLSPDRRIMVASYTVKGDSFAPGKPQVWSQKRLLERPSSTFDLAPNGKRFAVFLYPDGTAEEEHKLTDSITVLLNFGDELQRRVPAGGR